VQGSPPAALLKEHLEAGLEAKAAFSDGDRRSEVPPLPEG
jgi:hypothetical protein